MSPSAWSGADNGAPLFTKWFSRAEEEYSPDLNSWAVLTAFQNVVHALEDGGFEPELLATLQRTLYLAETSCYWYWTGQDIWDGQVTAAVNQGMAKAEAALADLLASGMDKTGPAIFLPWVRPANPGGSDWGEHGSLRPAVEEATFRTFVYDITGVEEVTLQYHEVGDTTQSLSMECLGPYPSATGPSVVATQYRAILPPGSGNIRYHVEAVDGKGNRAFSPLARIYIGA